MHGLGQRIGSNVEAESNRTLDVVQGWRPTLQIRSGPESRHRTEPLLPSSVSGCWTKPLRGRFKASLARVLQDGQLLMS